MKTDEWIAGHAKMLTHLSDTVWQYAEQALQEERSAAILRQVLQEAGFDIEEDLGGMSTAFSASWGSGKPVIGFLGEYDALAGLSQKPVAHREALVTGGCGHGCGHNLLGVGALGATLALQQRMQELGLHGTIKFFGCPAEEIMTGKIRMAAAGCFDGLDAALTWHPWQTNFVVNQPFLAMNTAKFTFHGVSAHASANPELGRSALDAVELMNVGVNYLREHVPTDVRIHYSITNGGGEPNLVHARAQSYYYIRALRRQSVDSVFKRVVAIAHGAAQMTETQVEIELLSGCWHILPNKPLNELLYSCMIKVPTPQWSKDEQEFARESLREFPPEKLEEIRSSYDGYLAPGELLDTHVQPLGDGKNMSWGSTDVSDVSWITPVAMIGTCCTPMAAMCHSWQMAASVGMSIGHKGMLYAAQVLALAGERLITDGEVLTRAGKELECQRGNIIYQSITPKHIS
jgi:aminobenzoyl-glutamate utilization protein B